MTSFYVFQESYLCLLFHCILVSRLGMRLVAVRSIVERELMALMKQQPHEEGQQPGATTAAVNQPNLLIGNIERELRDDGYHLAQASEFQGKEYLRERDSSSQLA